MTMRDGIRKSTKVTDVKSSKVDWSRRLLTAGVAIPLLLGLLSLDNQIWVFFVLTMIGVGYREFATLIEYEFKLIYVALPVIYYFWGNQVVTFALVLLLLFVPLIQQGPMLGIRNGMLNILFLNIFAIPIMYGARMHAELSNGSLITLLWILISFASDAGALIVGSRWGSHPLCPSISPKKTWEGFYGGFVGGVGSATFFYFVGIGGHMMTMSDFVFLGFMEALLGSIGDLIESGFKRFVSAKDASGLLPGHGGMLDRLDALAATAPFVYAYCLYRNL